MTEILQVDADALRGLGRQLDECAGIIDALTLNADVTMPDSPVRDATADVGAAALGAFRALAANIAEMALAAESGANTYERVEQLFTEQFERLRNEGSR